MSTANQSAKKKILIIAANPAVSPTTGWPIGFWWAELTHPYTVFTEAGYEIDIRSPDGGRLSGDGYSDPEDASGYSANDLVSLGFKKSARHAALLDNTASTDGVSPADYDAVFVIGGQSPMVTFRGNRKLAALVAAFYEAGKPTALVCHGTCLLLEATLKNGELLAKGKTWTGFANSEEQYADSFVGRRIQPFWIEDEAKQIAGTRYVAAPMFAPFAIRDGLLVTGQQQNSGRPAAELVVELLESSPVPTGIRTRGASVELSAGRGSTPRKLAILGAGNIGGGLARAWRKQGHDVVLGVRDAQSDETRALLAETGARAATVFEAAREAEIVVLALPYPVLEGMLGELAPLCEGKLVIDCTNAIAPGFALKYGHTTSAAEENARRLPGARLVKTFSAQGAENLARPSYDGERATNFYVGDDAEAKQVVHGLIEDVGLEAVDAGPLKNARLVEPLTLLWISLAGRVGSRDIAFKLLRR